MCFKTQDYREKVMFFEDVDNCYETSQKSKVERKVITPQMLAPSSKEKLVS